MPVKLEGEGDGGQSSQSTPFRAKDWEQMKQKSPSPSMRQPGYHQIHADADVPTWNELPSDFKRFLKSPDGFPSTDWKQVWDTVEKPEYTTIFNKYEHFKDWKDDNKEAKIGDKFTSEAGILTIDAITGSIAHLINRKGENFMFRTSALREVKAKRRSVSFNVIVNHTQVEIFSEDNTDKDLWDSMKEIFHRLKFQPAEANEKSWYKLDTNVEDESAKLEAEIKKEGYEAYIENIGANKFFNVYLDVVTGSKQLTAEETVMYNGADWIIHKRNQDGTAEVYLQGDDDPMIITIDQKALEGLTVKTSNLHSLIAEFNELTHRIADDGGWEKGPRGGTRKPDGAGGWIYKTDGAPGSSDSGPKPEESVEPKEKKPEEQKEQKEKKPEEESTEPKEKKPEEESAEPKEEKLEEAPTEKKTEPPTDFKGPAKDEDSLSGDAQTDQKIVALLDKLSDMAKDAKSKGEKAPNYDLCQVSIPGTNLFCGVNKGIPRIKMPQLKGQPTPGSPAEKEVDSEGQVDGEKAFFQSLKDKGVKVEHKTMPATQLKASQTELVGYKVAGMMKALEKNPDNPGIKAPIFVSKDGYILDGHHRWAAVVSHQLAKGDGKPVEMDVQQVDMDIEELIKYTNDWSDEFGIGHQSTGALKYFLAMSKKLAKMLDIHTAAPAMSLEGKLIEEMTSEELITERDSLMSYLSRSTPDEQAEMKERVQDIEREIMERGVTELEMVNGSLQHRGKNMKPITTSAEADAFDLTDGILASDQKKAYDEHMPNPVKTKQDYATPGEKEPDGYTAAAGEFKVGDSVTPQVGDMAGKIGVIKNIDQGKDGFNSYLVQYNEGGDDWYEKDEITPSVTTASLKKKADRAGAYQVIYKGKTFDAFGDNWDQEQKEYYTLQDEDGNDNDWTFYPDRNMVYDSEAKAIGKGELVKVASLKKKADESLKIGDEVWFNGTKGTIIEQNNEGMWKVDFGGEDDVYTFSSHDLKKVASLKHKADEDWNENAEVKLKDGSVVMIIRKINDHSYLIATEDGQDIPVDSSQIVSYASLKKKAEQNYVLEFQGKTYPVEATEGHDPDTGSYGWSFGSLTKDGPSLSAYSDYDFSEDGTLSVTVKRYDDATGQDAEKLGTGIVKQASMINQADDSEYPTQVIVTIKGEQPYEKTIKSEAELDKLIAKLDEKYGEGAYDFRFERKASMKRKAEFKIGDKVKNTNSVDDRIGEIMDIKYTGNEKLVTVKWPGMISEQDVEASYLEKIASMKKKADSNTMQKYSTVNWNDLPSAIKAELFSLDDDAREHWAANTPEGRMQDLENIGVTGSLKKKAFKVGDKFSDEREGTEFEIVSIDDDDLTIKYSDGIIEHGYKILVLDEQINRGKVKTIEAKNEIDYIASTSGPVVGHLFRKADKSFFQVGERVKTKMGEVGTVVEEQIGDRVGVEFTNMNGDPTGTTEMIKTFDLTRIDESDSEASVKTAEGINCQVEYNGKRYQGTSNGTGPDSYISFKIEDGTELALATPDVGEEASAVFNSAGELVGSAMIFASLKRKAGVTWKGMGKEIEFNIGDVYTMEGDTVKIISVNEDEIELEHESDGTIEGVPPGDFGDAVTQGGAKKVGSVKTADDAHEKKEQVELTKMQKNLDQVDETMKEMFQDDSAQMASVKTAISEKYKLSTGKSIDVWDLVVNGGGFSKFQEFLDYLRDEMNVSDLTSDDKDELKKRFKEFANADTGDY